MQHAADSTLLDLLYDAAVEPDRWVATMERFADRLGGNSAWLSRLSIVDGAGVAITARIDPAWPSAYHAHYGAMNPFSTTPDPQALMASWEPKVVTDRDWLDPETLVRTEYYNDFMRPQDVHGCIMLRLSARAREVCALTVNRSASAGAFSTADLAFAESMRPHIRRAFELTQKLSEVGFRSPDVEAALDRAGSGIFLLDGEGRMRRANRAAERLIGYGGGLSVMGGRLTATRSAAARRLAELIGKAASADHEVRSGGSMTVSVPGRRSPLSIIVAPVRTALPLVFGGRTSVLVWVTDPDAQAELSAPQLRELFGFTPAEAKVALVLLDGGTARSAAVQLGVSFHTVRHQIQSMLDKTGAARQSDLMALLARAAAGPAE